MDTDHDSAPGSDTEPEELVAGSVDGHEEGVTNSTPKRRGRPKGSKNKESLKSPPRDLLPNEKYFFQNRGGASKTSNSILKAQLLLDHDAYHSALQGYSEPHGPERQFLVSMHQSGFEQWSFELESGFSLCLYGYGSKKELVSTFAEYLYTTASAPPVIVMVNGYNGELVIQDILTSIWKVALRREAELPYQPDAALKQLTKAVTEDADGQPLYLFINSFDATPMRRTAVQNTVSALAQLPRIRLLVTADTLTFPLMWDTSLAASFRFVFHDCTTFSSYTDEIEIIPVVNTLLGRQSQQVGGRAGAIYVLRSLPQNAKSLYRLICTQQLNSMADEGLENEVGDNDIPNGLDVGPRQSMTGRSSRLQTASTDRGLEFRALYRKAAENFICSSEVACRTMLKEFQDHDMIEFRRDAAGIEKLCLPVNLQELEALLEEMDAAL